jgi:hypothetical protein
MCVFRRKRKAIRNDPERESIPHPNPVLLKVFTTTGKIRVKDNSKQQEKIKTSQQRSEFQANAKKQMNA